MSKMVIGIYECGAVKRIYFKKSKHIPKPKSIRYYTWIATSYKYISNE